MRGISDPQQQGKPKRKPQDPVREADRATRMRESAWSSVRSIDGVHRPPVARVSLHKPATRFRPPQKSNGAPADRAEGPEREIAAARGAIAGSNQRQGRLDWVQQERQHVVQDQNVEAAAAATR